MSQASEQIARQNSNAANVRNIWGKFIVNPNEFGAYGDGIHDDTLAIQKCLNSITRPTKITFPSSMYRISGKLTLPPFVIEIEGGGMYPTFLSLFSSTNITAIFDTNDSVVYEGISIRNFGILCNGKADYGFRSEKVNHAEFHRVNIQGANVSAIYAKGYSNVFNNCEIYSNNGDGISCYGGAINNVSIVDSKIYANGGVGVLVGGGTDGGLNINIRGNGIEQNAKAGIVAYNCKALNIKDNYFERNSAVGYNYTIPESINIKSDIHLLAYNGAQIGNDVSYSCDCVDISGNHTTPLATGVPGLNTDSFIFISLANRVRIAQNQVFDTTKYNEFISIYRNNKYSGVIGELEVTSNSMNSIEFIGSFNAGTEMFRQAHLIKMSDTLTPTNYANQNFLSWSAIAGSSGSFRRSDVQHNNYPVFALDVGDRFWGDVLDLSKCPELKGKYVWFGCWYNTQGGNSNIGMILDGQSEINSTTFDNVSGWRFKSVCRRIDPGAATILYGVQRNGSDALDVLISHPILAIMGDSAQRFPTPSNVNWKRGNYPLEGKWAVGDRILNINPAVGQPKAWICTNATGSGTWASEGNL